LLLDGSGTAPANRKMSLQILGLIRLTQSVMHECHFLLNGLHQQMCFGGKAIPVFPGYKRATCFPAN
jgi:hypothetical protein